MGFLSILTFVLAIVTAFMISYLSMPVIIKIAGLKKLLDEPDNVRKLHKTKTPTLGGIGIFSAFLISFSVWGNAVDLESYPFFIAALFMLLLAGMTDDIIVISPTKKLIIQFFAASELVIAGKVVITNFGGVFGIYEVPFWIAAILTILIIVAFVNSLNLIDGIDGLAGGIGIIVSALLGIWFLGAGFYSFATLSFTLSGALLGFMIYNMHPAKIFMGDTGAMAVGFILAFIVIQFIRLNDTMVATSWHIENAHVFAFAVMIVPAIDTIRVIIVRIASGLNPFQAAHNHTHHELIDLGISPHYASFSLWIANLLVIAFVYSICDLLDPTVLLAIVILIGFMIPPTIKWMYQSLHEYQLKYDGTFIINSFHYRNSENKFRNKNEEKKFSGLGKELNRDGNEVGV